MPIYEYQCAQCGYHFDKLQKINDPVLQQCPECGIDALKKLVSAPSFKLKGSGWYETDFKDKKPKTAEGKNTATEKKTAAPKSKSNTKAKQDKTAS